MELNNYIKNLQDQIDRGIVEQKEIFLVQDELSQNLEVRYILKIITNRFNSLNISHQVWSKFSVILFY